MAENREDREYTKDYDGVKVKFSRDERNGFTTLSSEDGVQFPDEEFTTPERAEAAAQRYVREHNESKKRQFDGMSPEERQNRSVGEDPDYNRWVEDNNASGKKTKNKK